MNARFFPLALLVSATFACGSSAPASPQVTTSGANDNSAAACASSCSSDSDCSCLENANEGAYRYYYCTASHACEKRGWRDEACNISEPESCDPEVDLSGDKLTCFKIGSKYECAIVNAAGGDCSPGDDTWICQPGLTCGDGNTCQ